WAVALGAAAWSVRTLGVRLALINLAAASLGLGGFEAYLWLLSPSPVADEVSYSNDYFAPDPVLGYGPRRGVVTEAVKRHRGEPVYRATYSIGENGLRLTPAAPAAATSVLFFGGSVTFGEGLDDDQSMPYRVGARYGGDVRVYNFGFHGYGPHQMLAALEHGWVASVVSGPVAAVVYQAIPAHVARSAGRAPWDREGPWYRLDGQGRARFAGHFDDRLGARVAAVLDRSFTYRRIFGLERGVSDGDLALFAAIVARAREEASRRFPASRFVVLLWGYQDDPTFERVLAALRGRRLSVALIRDILPGYDDDPQRYQIGPHDRHPNPLAQDLIAAYLVEDLLGPLNPAPR
ncbi:MAG: hypothetical protein OER43_18745, partial [Gammaproteobacteria bacterium]|nr:hypothetical protein [Gammaproteobacteria bacterium]